MKNGDYVVDLSTYFTSQYKSCEKLNKIYLTSVSASEQASGADINEVFNGDALIMLRGANFSVFDKDLGHNILKTYESVYAKYQGDSEEFVKVFLDAYPEVRALMNLYGAKTINELTLLMSGTDHDFIYNLAKEACEYFGNDFYAYYYEFYNNLGPTYGDITVSIRNGAKQYNYTQYENAQALSDLSYADFKKFCDYMNGCFFVGSNLRSGYPSTIVNNLDNYLRELGCYNQ